MPVDILINENGDVVSVYNDDMRDVYSALGDFTLERASHVEPTHDGRWLVDLSPFISRCKGLPYMYAFFEKRRDAIKFEIEWIRRHLNFYE
jgi:hypothetical protein